jgi:hypothetical protein
LACSTSALPALMVSLSVLSCRSPAWISSSLSLAVLLF